MPIVLISSKDAPDGSPLPANRIGAPGTATSTTPTRARIQPIVSPCMVATVEA